MNKMDILFRKNLAIFLSCIVLSFSWTTHNSYSNWNMRTPELFGDKQAYVLNMGETYLGYVWGDGIGFIILGNEQDKTVSGTMFQVQGEKINNAQYPETPITFKMLNKGNKFSGWIFFRGHERKFCGARYGYQFPEVCMLR
jgi:hypothetical protein